MSDKETPPYDMSIHSNPSAIAWTKFFRECRPECNIDDDTMFGWFANAMMAMHDHIYQTRPTKREPLSEEDMTEIASNYFMFSDESIITLLRNVEKAHGIGAEDENKTE